MKQNWIKHLGNKNKYHIYMHQHAVSITWSSMYTSLLFPASAQYPIYQFPLKRGCWRSLFAAWRLGLVPCCAMSAVDSLSYTRTTRPGNQRGCFTRLHFRWSRPHLHRHPQHPRSRQTNLEDPCATSAPMSTWSPSSLRRKTNIFPWKMMVGRLHSFENGPYFRTQ